MSRIENGIIIIKPQADAKCELCGKIDELRPYGPNGENICFECGMKDEETTKKQFESFLSKGRKFNPIEN